MGNNRQKQYKFADFYELVENSDDIPCQDIPDIFFPDDFPAGTVRNQATTMAKKLCGECPIRIECLLFAVSNKEPYGIWGGTTPNER